MKARETDVQFRNGRGDVFRHLCYAPYAVDEGEVVVSGQEFADLGRVSRRYAIAQAYFVQCVIVSDFGDPERQVEVSVVFCGMWIFFCLLSPAFLNFRGKGLVRITGCPLAVVRSCVRWPDRNYRVF